MSAGGDVRAYLEKMQPAKGQSIEEFAREGLRWQIEIYSANVGGDIGLVWELLSERERDAWIAWAAKKFKDRKTL